MEEPRPLSLYCRSEILAPCPDKYGGCGKEKQTNHGTMDQGVIQNGRERRDIAVIGDSMVRGIETILCHEDQVS